MKKLRHKSICIGALAVLLGLLLTVSAGATYKNRIIISANVGGALENTAYKSHGCLGQNIVSDWEGLESDGILIGIMHFSELYDWMLPVVDESDLSQLPREFQLHQNFPNPFNPMTTIRYDVPKSAHVNITVYNTGGQQVAMLVDGMRLPGYHEVIWDAAGLSSGVYFYRIHAGDYVALKKLMLIK
ncbi:MAG TPA: T9SS type A sorting domain-containing protein [bacterium]|jgi:hypothetical protein